MTLVLTNATYLDSETLGIRTVHLAVEPGPFGGVAPVDILPPDAAILDCTGKLVMRAFACGHHHVYSTLARGMPAAARAPGNFREMLEYVWWRLDKRLDKDMTQASALAAALYCAKCGVTFVIDHHAAPFAVEGSLETIARAFDTVGIGHLLCCELSDRDGDGPKEAGLAETDAYLSSGRKGHVGLHASFTVDDDLLRRAVALAAKHGTGLHVHVAEDIADQAQCLEVHGTRVVRRFQAFGALDLPHSIFTHCVHLDEAERQLVGSSPAWVAQNTESNQNNGVGLTGYEWAGPRVMLGTDGLHSDMLRSAKAAYLAGQALEGIDPAGMYGRFRAVHGLAAAMGAPGGGANNLVVLDYDSPTDVTPANFPSHFIYGLEARHVHTVIAQGRVIVADRRLVSADEADILAYAREQALRLWARLEGC